MMVHTEVEHRIRQLPAGVVNKIAAGEVIERPASVVKELMENSVDALATRIEVDIELGGTELIRIVDNGEGIHPDDVELSVSAHATSKLREADDLFRVTTRGFRGEALASISEVSRFKLRTKQEEQLTGIEMEVDGGIVKEPKACGCPRGTQIEVRQLFLNTPVRRKFMKTPATEFAHISEQFTRIAIACPNLHLVLRHNGRVIYELPATNSLKERLALFHGDEVANSLIPVEAEYGTSKLWGYVAHPAQSKSTRKGQYLFLNGRWIQDRSLQHALGEAYRGLLMVGRFPVAFLFLEIPPDQVDVNVHPTKSEVRFLDSSQLYRLLLSTLRTKFLGMDLGSRFKLDKQGGGSGSTQHDPHADETRRPVDPARQEAAQQELKSWAEKQLAGWKPKEDLSDLEQQMRELTAGEPPAIGAGTNRIIPDTGDDEDSAEPSTAPQNIGSAEWYAAPRHQSPGANEEGSQADTSATSNTAQSPPQTSFSPGGIVHVATHDDASRPTSADAELRAMQVHDCYLVVESGAGLTVIDQHALHERIMYEHLRTRVLAGSLEVQRLLMPIPIELNPREAGLLLDQVELLKELGLLVEDFGGNTVAISGYPTMLRKADPVELLRSVVEQLESSGQKVSRRDLLDTLLHMMSCKAAIKAGQRLTPEEISSLLAQRHLVDDAHHCPHGRPTALTLSRDELDRQFGRLG